ncbi:DUF2157 domain-containing protein [Hoeflea sp.]|uniref:DUF2157 domain-containing protein n=1 Tax=Hoeflea sp. TaxID=1940281 RepID=UPI003A93465F
MFRRYLSREINVWTQNGLLQPGQGEALLKDHDSRHTGFNLSSVLAVLAAILFGGAVIALVAANWEAIARPMRVLMIFVFIIGGLTAAAYASRRNAYWVTEAALVFTLLCYGAGIALVGQMYHLSGDEAGFMLAWTMGALVVAIGFSSAMAAVSAGVLGLGYMVAESAVFASGSSDVINVSGYVSVMAVAIVIGVSAWRSRSAMAGHLCALLIVGWFIWLVVETTEQNPGYTLAALGAAAFAAGSIVPSSLRGLVSRHGVVSAYGAILLLSGLGMIQLEISDAGLAGEMVLAGIILLASVAVLAIAGGENRLIRSFAYFAFACETIYVVGETLGSLLGSSGFLFLGGVVLAVIAFVVMKLERRFKAGRTVS